MAKTRMEEEEDPSCESTRGKESKFVAERSETGMDGNRGSSGSGSANSNNDSPANESDRKNDANRNRAGGRGRYRVPSNFCRDFIFYSCKRRGCKFIHPDVDSAEYKEARASRPELAHRERERSRSPLPEMDSSGKPTVCRDFLRNMCYRGKDCRYKHPSDGDKEDLPWPQLCIDYRSGNCKRYDCRFLHYTTDDEEYFMRTGTVRRELWQHFISITLKDSKILKSRPVCKLFMQSGECTMDVCRYRHVTQREYEEEMFHVICQMVFEKCRRINPDIPPPSASLPLQPDADLPPPRPTPFHDYEHETSRRDYEWPREPAPPRDPYGFPKPLPEVLPREVDQLTRENMDLRRIISDDSARFKVDIDRLNMENAKLQEQLNYLKSSGSGALPPQMSLLQQEHAELSAKVKSLNDWNVELQAKYSTTRRECDEMRDSVKVLNLELATVNDEKIKLKRKSDELEAKLQVAQAGKEEASLAIEKKEYLESKLRQYYDTMKRCEAEFVSVLEKNFHINTPNVMSYFPSWGYLMSFVTDIVSQINSTVPASTVSSMASVVPSSYSSYGGYSLPPPSVTSAPTSSMPYGGYPPTDFSTAGTGGGASFATQQQPQVQSGVYGSASNAYSYGGGYPTTDGMYGSSNSYVTSGVAAASTNSSSPSSVSDGRKAGSKKDNHLAPPPWKSDGLKRDRHM